MDDMFSTDKGKKATWLEKMIVVIGWCIVMFCDWRLKRERMKPQLKEESDE